MRFRHFDNLRSFVVVGRHLNMSTAAGELNLSKGAVSYQIQQLEAELGFEVFTRQRRRLALTRNGSLLYQQAQRCFDMLEAEIEQLQPRPGLAINIGMATYFASRWLSPRLMRFIGSHGDIALRIQPLIDLTDLSGNGLDMAVRWGKGGWKDKGMCEELIFKCPAMLSASIEIGTRIEAEGVAAVMQEVPLLHDRDDSVAWQEWMQCAGLEVKAAVNSLVIPDPNVRVQAVIDGQGMALYDFLVEDEVANQRLYQYQSIQLVDYGYYLIYPENTENAAAEMMFRTWIMDEASSLER
ncbi:MAG: DNA-binding transcriptional LysR family regulator [Planctomycetota bacterium]|jgi:DNA-binding transcriptional LysR family regulator